MKIKKISIIIPVYNEIKTLTKLVKKVKKVNLKKLNLEKEIIVIDDGSDDGGEKAIKNLSGIKAYFHKKNEGKGASIKTGIKYSTGEIILIQDADLEYNPEDYPKIILPY